MHVLSVQRDQNKKSYKTDEKHKHKQRAFSSSGSEHEERPKPKQIMIKNVKMPKGRLGSDLDEEDDGLDPKLGDGYSD